MKKLIFVFTLLFLSTVTYGQFLQGYGIKGGIGLTNQSVKNGAFLPDDLNTVTGVSIRLFADFLDISIFNTQFEASFNQKGTKIDSETISGILEYNFLSFAVMAKIDAGMIYFLAGPQYNILIENRITSDIDINTLGITLGLGTQVKELLPFTLLFEYRFENDLTSSVDSDFLNVKNYSHTLMVGVKF